MSLHFNLDLRLEFEIVLVK